jgi:hypothetical protein
MRVAFSFVVHHGTCSSSLHEISGIRHQVVVSAVAVHRKRAIRADTVICSGCGTLFALTPVLFLHAIALENPGHSA